MFPETSLVKSINKIPTKKSWQVEKTNIKTISLKALL
jgi:hypothetical protein